MSGAAGAISFGPGSLESIRLERRRFGARRFPNDVQLQARVRGTFRMYCGNGNEHTATITGGWYTVAWPQHPQRAIDTQYTFMDADALAHELIADVLDDWTDPCEEGQ